MPYNRALTESLRLSPGTRYTAGKGQTMPRTTLTKTLILAGLVAGGAMATGACAKIRSTKAGATRRCKPGCGPTGGGSTATSPRRRSRKTCEWMKAIGMGGGLVFDAGGATQGGHDARAGGAVVRLAAMA